MKFIPLGDKHAEYDFLEDLPREPDTGKPRKIPSYIETAKKHKKKQPGMLK
ncbi:MAG: hypothetical protein IKW64_00795 [Clostridia bacterium]|nr:hypothetical protein [Clostridia bacterium]